MMNWSARQDSHLHGHIAREFLRLGRLLFRHSPKIWCGRSDLHAHAPGGAAVFKTARSSVPRTAAEFGRGGRSRTGTGNHAQRVLSPSCLRSNHAANEIGAGGGNRTLIGFRPSASRTDVSTVPPRPQKMEHPQGRAPCSLSYQDSPSLSTAWMHGRSGRTRTFVAREGVAFTARCICCFATLRKNWGLERDSHPRPSPYEGAALTAAPSSQMVGRLGNAPSSAA